LAGAGSVILAGQSVTAAQAEYAAAGRSLDVQLAAAAQAGYGEQDLQPVQDQLTLVRAAHLPLLVWAQPGFYSNQASRLRGLQADLHQTQAQVDQNAKQDLDQQLATAKTGIDRARTIDVADAQTTGLAGRYDDLVKRQFAATTIADVRKADTDAKTLVTDVIAAGSQQTAENTAIQTVADTLTQQGASLATMQSLGNTSLAAGRNDATVAAYEAKPGRFAALTQLMDAYNRMEHYAARIGSADPQQAAFGTAAVQRYAGLVHSQLMQNLGPKHVIVSFEAQHVWVYDAQKVVLESAVTTGIRGSTAYGTDFGPMKVLHNDHPFKMHSPWPKGSVYWYPDTVVQWTVFFTNSGESFHDASWESDYQLGPGSQYNASTRSHGCIHIPYSDAQWLYGWADVGTPVDVVPGDGQPLAAQLAEMTTDDQGVPLNPA
jgi:lipoprotein-anchoring transpeptidase ErfK/SrfK